MFLFLFTQIQALTLDKELTSFSFKITKQEILSEQDFTMGYFLQCSGQTSAVCQELCQGKSCLINEDACEGCISSNNYNLYALYYDLKSVYSIDNQQSSVNSVFSQFFNKELFIIDSTSIFGLLTDVSDSSQLGKVKAEFLNSCPKKSDTSFLILSKNENKFMQLEFLVCQGTYGQMIFKSHYNQEYQND